MLSNEEAGKLIKAIFNFVTTGEIPAFDERCLDMAFVQIKNTLERDNEKYEETCKKNAKNASMRWEKKEAKNATAYDRIQSYANYADSDNDSVNDNDSDNESDKDSDSVFMPFKKENMQDIKKAFNVIYNMYPNKEQSNYEEALKWYSQIIQGYTYEGKVIQLSTIDFEILFKEIIGTYKEESKTVLLEDFFRKYFWKEILKLKE